MFQKNKYFLYIIGLIILVVVLFPFLSTKIPSLQKSTGDGLDNLGQDSEDQTGGLLTQTHPLQIEMMRKDEYPGSDLVIEQTLDSGINYSRYIASYKSDGLKIFGLLTIPSGERPASGWPVVIFNHGYIPPAEYRTTERYIAYVDTFARSGYIVFKSDYRGHGSSEGNAAGGYGSTDYTVDVLNAVSSIKKLKDQLIYSSSEEYSDESRSSRLARTVMVDPNRIGMWGHSMGGQITLRSMVVGKDIKAGVIWAGVVASYPDLIYNWRRGSLSTITPSPRPGARRWRQELQQRFGTPESNPQFWDSISPSSYLKDITGPLQLHHGTADHSVPVEFSKKLEGQMKDAGKEVEYYEYEGDDHNIAGNLNTAAQRSLEFFDKYVKNL